METVIVAKYKDAVWLPMTRVVTLKDGTRRVKREAYGARKRTDAVILHVDGGGAKSLAGWWNNPASGSNGSHFYVRQDGVVEQYADTDFITWTSVTGSLRSVGIETQGVAAGPWTAPQLASIIKLVTWLCDLYAIPVRLMASSKVSERGIGYHWLGVPRTSSASVSQTGGERWSVSPGKVCPGPDRIRQMPALVAAVAAGNTTEDDMYNDDDRRRDNEAAARIMGFLTQRFDKDKVPARAADTLDLGYARDQIMGELVALRAAVAALAVSGDVSVEDVTNAVETALGNYRLSLTRTDS